MEANWNELPFAQRGTTRGMPRFRGTLLPVFLGDGREDFSLWCRRFEVVVEADPAYEEVSLAKLLPTCLGGAAFSYWDSLPEITKLNYDTVKNKLKSVFGQTAFLSSFQSFVNARSRLPGEALPVFAAEICRLVEEAFPTYEKNAKEGEKFRCFVAGIEPYLQLRCHEQGVKTLESALRFALQVETAHQASRIFPNAHPSTLQFATSAPTATAASTPPGYLPAAQVPLGVNSASSSDDFRKMQQTVERLSDTVQQLQLEMRQQRREREDRDMRRRHSPDQRHSQHSSAERGRRNRHDYTPEGRRESSYDRVAARHGSQGSSPHRRDRQEIRARSDSHDRGYSPAHRDYARRGRSPDRREDTTYHHSAGRVRFHSPSQAQSNKVNYM